MAYFLFLLQEVFRKALRYGFVSLESGLDSQRIRNSDEQIKLISSFFIT